MTTEILRQREDTGHAAGGDEGRTLCGLLASTVQRRGGAFFAGLGMKILEVYGMTETTGLVTATPVRRGSRFRRGAGMPPSRSLRRGSRLRRSAGMPRHLLCRP